MRLTCSLLFIGLTCLFHLGCGGSSSPETVKSSEIQDYIDNNPEMAARQKARQNPDIPTK